MCGIVGYVGPRDCTPVLLEGLEKLEYRGYDSAGISVLEQGRIITVKSPGKLEKVREQLRKTGSPQGHCGIGHTRWATHGDPSRRNSHPHTGKDISLVHNGIIENDLQLRRELEQQGVSFVSDTDTEVILRLLEQQDLRDPLAALCSVLPQLKGSYALGILFASQPDTLYAVRKDSPLIVGTAAGEHFLASDIPAILPYTRQYYLLEENQIVVLTPQQVHFYDLTGHPVELPLLTASWDMEQAQKDGYPHFMLKEIHQQPETFARTIGPRLRNGLPDFSHDHISADLFSFVRRLRIVACGTAMHAGLVGKQLVERLAGLPVEVETASEFRYGPRLFLPGDLVVVISQSGETADSLAALRLAKERAVPTLAVVNVVGSSIAREADHVIYTYAGPEIAVASTKAYTVQLAVLDLLALSLSLLHGADPEQVRALTASLRQIPLALEQLLSQADAIRAIAEQLPDTHDLFFIGRSLDCAVAQEGSLKLKEISYVHSEAYPAGELKHGTISLITPGVPVVAIATQPEVYEKMVGSIKEVRARGARVLLLCRADFPCPERLADWVFPLPELDPLLMPALAVPPLQLFAYYMALLRGCDVDQPRNLAKSVTVE